MSDEKATPIHPIKIVTIVTGVVSLLLAFGAIGAADTHQPYRIQMGLGLGALGGSLLTFIGAIISGCISDEGPNDFHPDQNRVIQNTPTDDKMTVDKPEELTTQEPDDDSVEYITSSQYTPLNPGSWGVN
ncbi:MAG TPA: hypothetical protein VHE99_09565 [Gammaproteobacteria bacterium]|nr:hypothetical protein [Gammaproteobacteria bacterium]